VDLRDESSLPKKTIEEIAERFAVGQTFVKMLRQKRETARWKLKLVVRDREKSY